MIENKEFKKILNSIRSENKVLTRPPKNGYVVLRKDKLFRFYQWSVPITHVDFHQEELQEIADMRDEDLYSALGLKNIYRKRMAR